MQKRLKVSFLVLFFLFSILIYADLSSSEEKITLPKEITINNVEFILIPAGWFYFGQDQKDNNDPLAEVWFNKSNIKKIWLDDYYIAKYETRSSLFADFLNATKDESVMTNDTDQCIVKKGRDGKYSPIPGKENHPANGLSWQGADKFAKWAGFRLPTEAEWVKAARGTDKRHWPWGNAIPDLSYANFGIGVFSKKDAPDLLYPVDSYPKGKSPYGLYNMSGNIREWVEDWFSETYIDNLKDSERNPKGPPSGTQKMMKGGRWADTNWDIQVWSWHPKGLDDPFQCNGVRFAVDAATVINYLKKNQTKK